MPRPSFGADRWRALVVSAGGAAVPLISLAAWRPGGEIRATVVWGAILILCFAGWGRWLRRCLIPDVEVDWALAAAWGMALTVAVGGLLCFIGLARRPVLVAWICGGVALAGRELLAALEAPRRRKDEPAATPVGWELVLVVGMAAVTVFLAMGAAGHTFPNPSDDWPAYLAFIHRILETGSFIEPFSVRRMAAYGGQSFLQALALLIARDTQIQIFDGGVCLVLAVWMVLGFARDARRVSWTLLLLTALVLVMLPDGRANSASELSGVVGFVAVWRTLTFVDRRGLRGDRAALLIALPVAAVATLRQNYLPIAGFMVLALGARRDDLAETWRARGHFLGRVALWTLACLLPWMALALRSNRTFLFPILHGNFDPTYAGITTPSEWTARLKFCFADALNAEPIHALPALLLALPAVAAGANRRASLGLWLGTMVGFGFLAWSLPESDTYTVARYVFGYVVALAVVAGLAAAEETGAPLTKQALGSSGLVIAALALQIYGLHPTTLKSLNAALDRVRGIEGAPAPVDGTPEVEARMQASVPPGARLLVMIERPYLLDFARNPIALLDQPGAASPPPGIPLAAGAEPVAAYLQAHGFRYVAFVRSDKATIPLYTRHQWQAALAGTSRLWKLTAPVYLAAFDALENLAKSRRRLYDDGRLVVIDLAVSAPASPTR